jgi:hypothetical protein
MTALRHKRSFNDWQGDPHNGHVAMPAFDFATNNIESDETLRAFGDEPTRHKGRDLKIGPHGSDAPLEIRASPVKFIEYKSEPILQAE